MAALGIENTNRKYELLEEAFEEIKKGVILRQTKGKNFRWDHISLLERVIIESDNQDITLLVTNSAVKLLNELKQYTCISPQYYLPLTSSVQLWFYVFFKCNLANKKVRIAIDEIVELLNLSELYNSDIKPSAKSEFLKYVVGIKSPINTQAKTWDLTTDKDGNEIGTLAMICEKTDLMVSAKPIKKGRIYTHLEFTIKENKDRTSRTRRAKIEAQEKAVKEKAKVVRETKRAKAKAEEASKDTQQPIAFKEEDPKAKMMDITNRIINKFKC